MTADRWFLYDELLATVPEEALVSGYVAGRHWVMVESSLGGVGLAQHFPRPDGTDPDHQVLGRPLKEVAGLLKSWDYNLASLGMAALNAASNTMMLIPQSPLQTAAEKNPGDAFEYFLPKVAGKKVGVIGHFPHLEELAGHCRLSIFERQPQPGDLPDPAAEYLLPDQDLVYVTGTTFINKTITRLLELTGRTLGPPSSLFPEDRLQTNRASAEQGPIRGAEVCIVGPSTPMIPLLFKHGLHSLSGMVVTDFPELARAITEDCCDEIFDRGGVKVNMINESA